MSAPLVRGVCAQCGLDHRKPARVERLRRYLPNLWVVITEAFPCIYAGKAGEARLSRDLRALGARRSSATGEWRVST